MFLNLVPTAFFIATMGSLVYGFVLATRLVNAVEQIARSDRRSLP